MAKKKNRTKNSILSLRRNFLYTQVIRLFEPQLVGAWITLHSEDQGMKKSIERGIFSLWEVLKYDKLTPRKEQNTHQND